VALRARAVSLAVAVRARGGWLATRCEFLVSGKTVQLETYSDWRADVELSPALFDPATWASAPHWAHGAGRP